jgi:hypothetical protein
MQTRHYAAEVSNSVGKLTFKPGCLPGAGSKAISPFISRTLQTLRCERNRYVNRICAPSIRSRNAYPPVSLIAAATGFDSGDPRCRKKMESATMLPMARNSLCQFWNDSNQKRVVAR